MREQGKEGKSTHGCIVKVTAVGRGELILQELQECPPEGRELGHSPSPQLRIIPRALIPLMFQLCVCHVGESPGASSSCPGEALAAVCLEMFDNHLGDGGKRIHRICQFPWCKRSHHSRFQATSTIPISSQQSQKCNHGSPVPTSSAQHIACHLPCRLSGSHN